MNLRGEKQGLIRIQQVNLKARNGACSAFEEYSSRMLTTLKESKVLIRSKYHSTERSKVIFWSLNVPKVLNLYESTTEHEST